MAYVIYEFETKQLLRNRIYQTLPAAEAALARYRKNKVSDVPAAYTEELDPLFVLSDSDTYYNTLDQAAQAEFQRVVKK